MKNQTFFEVTQEAGKEFFMRQIKGSIVMLNLLRFKKIADYFDSIFERKEKIIRAFDPLGSLT